MIYVSKSWKFSVPQSRLNSIGMEWFINLTRLKLKRNHIGKLYWMNEYSKVHRVSLVEMNCLPQRPTIFPVVADKSSEKKINFQIYACYSSPQIVRHTSYKGKFKIFDYW